MSVARMPAAKPTGDLLLLQGCWSVATLEIEGQPMPAGGRITIRGGNFTTEAMGAEYKGKVTAVDGQIDLRFTSGPERGNTCLGIYKLKADTLHLCLALTATKRPTLFKTTPGSGLALETLYREGSKTAARAQGNSVSLPAALEPAPEIDGEWQLVSATMNGQPLPQEYIDSGRRIAANNEFRVVVMGQTMIHAHFTVDRSLQPATIDYYVHGPGKTIRLQHGIWQLDGDRLTTAIGAPGSPRPSLFESGPNTTFTVWQRIRP